MAEQITQQTLDNVAKIARMDLSETEKKNLKKDLEAILKTFSEIQDIELPNDEVYYVVDKVNPLRDDGKPQNFNTQPVLKNIPDFESETRLIKVPRGV